MTDTLSPKPPASAGNEPAIHLDREKDGVAIITFDRPSSSANLLDGPLLKALDIMLDEVSRSGARGLILRSAKSGIFIAGADIDSVLSNPDPAETERLIALGQEVMQSLADLSIPTAAAIHGACVGGGYELALACDYRIASQDARTKIGLPETQLGIVPAWGGCTRLPRLIGLTRALDIILGGKTVPASLARRYGMIDEVVPREYLLETARRHLERGKRGSPRGRASNTLPARRVIRRVTRRKLEEKTRGCYPALPAALDLVVDNLGLTISQGLANERRVIRELAFTPEARHLIGVYKLRERAKKIAREGARRGKAVTDLAVIGAGVMGAGIAQWCTSRGLKVTLTDVSPDQLARGMALVEKLYRQARDRHILSATEAERGLDRVTPYLGNAFSLRRRDLVIEAAVERMDVKTAIFRDLEARVDAETVLATNTSALSISALAATTSCADRVVGIHFFNPVHRMPLVELVRGEQTSAETLDLALSFVHGIGKLPVVVRDSPGFVVNRVLLPYMIEAGKLFEAGVGTERIDEAMRAFGMPMGPLRLLDEVGLDVAAHVAATLQEAFGERMAAPQIIHQLVKEGHLGRKTGRGFYVHGKRSRPAPNPRHVTRATTAGEIQERLVALMINEASRCLEEGVVDDPEDVDFAMIMGTGFAPFRGGPLRHADTVGLARVRKLLESLEVAPSGLLAEMVTQNRTFYTKSDANQTEGPPR